MFSSVIEVLDIVGQDGSTFEQKAEANALLDSLQSFEFVFNMHLMRIILGITYELSNALQQKEHDIVNAMTLVKISKEKLQEMRESG